MDPRDRNYTPYVDPNAVTAEELDQLLQAPTISAIASMPETVPDMAARENYQRNRRLSEMNNRPVGQIMSPEEFDQMMMSKTPKLFEASPYKDMSPLEANAAILEEEMPVDTTRFPEPRQVEPSDKAEQPTAATDSATKLAEASKEEGSDIVDTLNKKFTYGEGLEDEDLKAAQESAENRRFAVNIGRAVAGMNQGLTGVAADKGLYDDLTQQAGQRARDITTRREAIDKEEGRADKERARELLIQQNSPVSKTSETARKQLFALYPEYEKNAAFQNLSAAQIEKLYPRLKEMRDFEQKDREISAKRQEAELKAQKDLLEAQEKSTPGEAAREKDAGELVSNWIDKGNRAMIMSDIQKLREVEAELEEIAKSRIPSGVSGPITGRLPWQDLVNPQGEKIKNKIGSVVQKNLREILGGQFAQKEGEQLLERAYNPKLQEDVNLENVRALRMAMEQAAAAKDATAQDFIKGRGRLRGTPSSMGQSQPATQQSKGAIVYQGGNKFEVMPDGTSKYLGPDDRKK